MRKMKKMMALVIAMVMVLAMTVPATAAKITINQDSAADGTVGSETYELYKIFDVTKTSSVEGDVTVDATLGAHTDTGFSYTISTTNPWFAKLGTVTDGNWTPVSGQSWVTLTPSAGDSTKYNVVWSGENLEAAAVAFADWLLANKGTITADETMTSNAGAATKENVDDGYYLITSSLGTNLVLATSDISITTKNEYVTDVKTVAKTNYNVGDKVPYTITVNLPASIDYSKPVIVHDTMDDVLELDETSVHGKVTADNDFDEHLTLTKSEDFGTNHSASHTADAGKILFDFVLDISSLAPAAGTEPTAKTIIITYEAELLSTAAADTALVNKEFTEYSKYESAPKEASFKTYDFDLEKTFTGGNENLVATFNLYASTTGGAVQDETPGTTSKAATPLAFVEETPNEKYVKADSNDTNTTTTISAKHGKKLNVRGLAEGTYYLTELSTADGYNLLTEDIVIAIDADGNATVKGDSDLYSANNNEIKVVNNSGSVLPSTGGIGTTLFYVIGAILVLAAGVLLVARRRTHDE